MSHAHAYAEPAFEPEPETAESMAEFAPDLDAEAVDEGADDAEFDVSLEAEAALEAALESAADEDGAESETAFESEEDGAFALTMEDVQAEAAAGGAVEETAAPASSGLSLTMDLAAEAEQVRMLEALLFAAAEPLDEATLAARLPAGADVPRLIALYRERLQGRGVELARVANGWRLQTPADLAWLLEDVREERRKLSAAARETLAIIAYHQPVTRAEVEEIRGVAVSKGTVDMLMELGWVRMRGRRRAPGRPVTYGTTDAFLAHFGLESLTDLPGKAELKAAGLLDSRLPADFSVPEPGLFDASNEDPLEGEGVEESSFHVDFLEENDETAAPAQAQSA